MTNQSVSHPLTLRDLDVLIEAVEAWENKDLAGNIMSELLTGMLSERDPASKLRMQTERDERKRDGDQKQRQRKEQSVLLRAKLIQMLDERRASAFASESLTIERPS